MPETLYAAENPGFIGNMIVALVSMCITKDGLLASGILYFTLRRLKKDWGNIIFEIQYAPTPKIMVLKIAKELALLIPSIVFYAIILHKYYHQFDYRYEDSQGLIDGIDYNLASIPFIGAFISLMSIGAKATKEKEETPLKQHKLKDLKGLLRFAKKDDFSSSSIKTFLNVKDDFAVDVYNDAGKEDRNRSKLYKKEWKGHINNNKKYIMKSAKKVKNTGTAAILGVGDGLTVPLKELVKRFDKVILVDIDRESMSQLVNKLPEKLQKKVEIRVEDITGVSLDLMREAKNLINKHKDDKDAAFHAIQDLLNNADIENIALSGPDDSYDFVVSKMIISNLAAFPIYYIEKEFEKQFGADTKIKTEVLIPEHVIAIGKGIKRMVSKKGDLESWEWIQTKENFISRIERSHIGLLRDLVNDKGRVFVSDTATGYTLKGLNNFDNKRFFISGDGRKIHENNIGEILKKDFRIEEESSWDWMIQLPAGRVAPGYSSRVEAYDLIPRSFRQEIDGKMDLIKKTSKCI